VHITCLVDNAVEHSSDLWGEHGAAFLIESEDGRVLLDAGKSGTVLLHNMDGLGIAPETLSALAISHAHNDHTGGLALLLERLPVGVPLVGNADLYRERFSRAGAEVRQISPTGLRERIEARTTPSLSDGPQEILPGVWTTGEIRRRSWPEGRSAKHVVRDGPNWVADPYRDDLSVVIERGDELVLLCGCCHAGLLNTLDQIEATFRRPVTGILGGTHMVGYDDSQISAVAHELEGRQALKRLYLSHCTGIGPFAALWAALGADRVRPFPAGARLDLATME